MFQGSYLQRETEGGGWRMFHTLHGVRFFLKHLPSLMHLHLRGGAISEKREKKKNLLARQGWEMDRGQT